MPEPMKVPSGQVQKVFYGVWFGSLLLTAVVGVVIGQVWPRAGEAPTSQTAVNNITPPKLAQPAPVVPIEQREKVFGKVVAKTGSSITIEKFFLSENEKIAPQYVVQIDTNTTCNQTIIKDKGTLDYKSGACSEIMVDMFVRAVPTTKSLSTSFTAAELQYSKENPYLKK